MVVLAARYLLAPKPGRPIVRRRWTAFFPGLRPLAEGRLRDGTVALAVALLAGEMWLADQYLGTLMIVTLIVLVLGVLLYGSLASDQPDAGAARARNERIALAVLLVGVGLSAAGFFGYKNRTGAYQGSPAAFMDPKQPESGYPLDRVPVPARPPAMPAAAGTCSSRADRLCTVARKTPRRLSHRRPQLYVRVPQLPVHAPDARFCRITATVALQMVADARRLRDAADVQATSGSRHAGR